MCGPIGVSAGSEALPTWPTPAALELGEEGVKCSPNHFNLQSWESQDLRSNSVSSCRHSRVPSHHLILAVCWAHSGQIIGTRMTDCQVSALPPANLESSQGGFSNPAFWVPAACSRPQTHSLPPFLSPSP